MAENFPRYCVRINTFPTAKLCFNSYHKEKLSSWRPRSAWKTIFDARRSNGVFQGSICLPLPENGVTVSGTIYWNYALINQVVHNIQLAISSPCLKDVCTGCQSIDNSFAWCLLCSLCRGGKHFRSGGYWRSSRTNIIGCFRHKAKVKQLSEQACEKKILMGGKTQKRFITPLQQPLACNFCGIVASTLICIPGFVLPHLISSVRAKGWAIFHCKEPYLDHSSFSPSCT